MNTIPLVFRVNKYSLAALTLLCLLLNITESILYAQAMKPVDQEMTEIRLPKDYILLFKDTILVPVQDTVIQLPGGLAYKIKPNPQLKSTAFYDSLKVRSSRTRTTKELYKLLIRDNHKNKAEAGSAVEATSAFTPYTDYVIGNIRLKSVSVLEGNVDDTTITARSTYAKLADNTHVYTRDRVILNTLQFNKGEKVSPDVLSDNERLIRQLGFVHDARIVLVPRQDDSDTVDVVVITKDKIDYQFDLMVYSPCNFKINLKDNSVLGLGKEIGFNYLYNANQHPANGYTIFYHDRNFNRSFTDIKVEYSHYWAKEGTEIQLTKNFLTPQTTWGGGVSAGITSQYMSINDYQDTAMVVPFTHNFQDAWVGRSFMAGPPSQRKNIILSARFSRVEFTTRPQVSPDSNFYFFNDMMFLGGISYSHVSYIKSSMIRNYGVTEDIPVGIYAELNPGLLAGEFYQKAYLGLKGGWATYDRRWGYVNTSFNIGGFVHNQGLNQGAYMLSLGYFTPLLSLDHWRFRQFINFSYTGGLNRNNFKYISLSDQVYGLSDVRGNQRLSLRLESVFFQPLSFYGFQAAFFLFTDFAALGTGDSPEMLNTFYSSYGCGIRIRNEGLIMQSLEIRLGYVPRVQDGSGRFVYGISSDDPAQYKMLSAGRPETVKFH